MDDKPGADARDKGKGGLSLCLTGIYCDTLALVDCAGTPGTISSSRMYQAHVPHQQNTLSGSHCKGWGAYFVRIVNLGSHVYIH